MQRELEAYQDEEGEVVLKLRQELAQVQSHLQESNDKLELAQSKSAKAEQVTTQHRTHLLFGLQQHTTILNLT